MAYPIDNGVCKPVCDEVKEQMIFTSEGAMPCTDELFCCASKDHIANIARISRSGEGKAQGETKETNIDPLYIRLLQQCQGSLPNQVACLFCKQREDSGKNILTHGGNPLGYKLLFKSEPKGKGAEHSEYYIHKELFLSLGSKGEAEGKENEFLKYDERKPKDRRSLSNQCVNTEGPEGEKLGEFVLTSKNSPCGPCQDNHIGRIVEWQKKLHPHASFTVAYKQPYQGRSVDVVNLKSIGVDKVVYAPY